MNGLETQVGQIFISNKKLSKSFISLQSEKILETEAELFILTEIEVLNSKAWNDADKVAKIFLNGLKKNFRRTNANSFENSIAEINQEMSSLASGGISSWLGKTNACLAVRQNDNLFIATTGKIQAYLLRENQLTNLADSPEKPSPLKIFENFALGKINKDDFLVISTPQLFNYISLDRFKQIIASNPLATACQNIGNTMKQNADQTVSFGTFILQFGENSNFDAVGHIEIKEKGTVFLKQTALSAAAFTGSMLKKAGSKAYEYGKDPAKLANALPKIKPHQLSEQLKEQARAYSDIKKIKELPKTKKFFLISAAIFLIFLITNIAVVAHSGAIKKRSDKLNSQVNAIQDKINQANISSIYSNDPAQTLSILYDAQNQLGQIPSDKLINARKQQLSDELVTLLASAGHLKKVNTIEILTYNANVDSIKFSAPDLYLIDSTNNKVTPYDLKQNSLLNPLPDNHTSITTAAVDLAAAGKIPEIGLKISPKAKAIVTKSNLYILDPDNKEIIMIDRKKSTLTFQFSSNNFTNLRDFAVDETGKIIYILNDNRILSFQIN